MAEHCFQFVLLYKTTNYSWPLNAQYDLIISLLSCQVNETNYWKQQWLWQSSGQSSLTHLYIFKPIMFHFRLNSHYIFFLLQVTEAVNLKRAETTAFRKANRLSRYTRSFLKESDKSTLQRTNQGYKQFKSMRGTAPYFEQQKLRLFSMIR